MRWLLLLTLLALTADADDRAGRFDRFCRQRSDRGLPCDGYAFFENLTASGSAECDGSTPSILSSFTRAGTDSCAKSTGFAVTVTANQPSVHADGTDFEAAGTDAQVTMPFVVGQTKVMEFVLVPDFVWKSMGAFVPLQIGTFSTANSMTLMVNAGIITYREWDGAAASVQYSYSTALAEGPRRIRVVVPPASAATIYVDGVAVTTGVSGLNTTRIASLPGTMRVGALAVNSFVTQARMRGLCLATSASTTPTTCLGTTPTEQSGRRIVGIGDSITAGVVAGSVSYPRYLQYLYGFNTNLVGNAGVGSTTAAQILGLWTNNVRGRGYTTILVMAGVNDINRDSQTAAFTWPSIKQILDEAKADGMTVAVATVMPFSGVGSKVTELGLLNATITAYAAGNGMLLFDAYSVMGNPGSPNDLLPAYNSGDNLHPSEAGKRALAAGWKAVLP